MAHAYDELYLPEAQRKLAKVLDLLVNTFGYSLTDAWQLFLQSKLSHRFETGDCSILAGRSGTEMVMDILEERGVYIDDIDQPILLELSEEYWTGWALAYYQWESGLTFAEIEKKVPIETIRAMYMPYHEMDISHFSEKMNELWHYKETEVGMEELNEELRKYKNEWINEAKNEQSKEMALSLSEQGVSFEVIAISANCNVETVEKWLQEKKETFRPQDL